MLPTDILVTPLPHQASVDLAIAACRAGAVGIVDLTWRDSPSGDCPVGRLARLGDGSFGARVSAKPISWQIESLEENVSRLSTLIISGEPTAAKLRELRKRLGDSVQLLVEVTRSDRIAKTTKMPIDGVILKGNEAGGWVAGETTLLLLQHWARLDEAVRREIPVYARGGIGPHTAAACLVAGAQGVVLDAQVVLASKSPLPSTTASWVRSYDGSQTHLLGESLGAPFRFAAPPSAPLTKQLRELELALQQKLDGDSSADTQTTTENKTQRRSTTAAARKKITAKWIEAVENAVESDTDPRTLVAGQDLAFAPSLADCCIDIRGIIKKIVDEAQFNLRVASELRPLEPDSSLAMSHGTGLPIVQGPMTRVSDTAEFAEAVAKEGGLPLLALALMRGGEADAILSATRERLGDQGWGAGLLGFLPPEIRNEQMAAVKKHRPPIALIAGGRPDQTKELEDIGIPSYLHAPSPGLLEMFLRDGARRFVFEGRECGGHVGPRSSFVLWESLVQILEAFATKNPKAVADLHLLFAGGIHDGLSAAMATSIAGRLMQLGAKVGVLMGSAYLFTKEAVDAGAIVPRFQQEAIRSNDTVLLETGPGHAIRCIRTPYRDLFDRERRRLASEGKSLEEITRELEWMNIGRLRVASKGLDRSKPPGGGKSKLEPVTSDKQYQRGMYMVGQVAALRDKVTTIGNLHAQVSSQGTAYLNDAASRLVPENVSSFTNPQRALPPCDVAIVGMSAIYPGADELDRYWQNILDKHYAVTEVPRETHWDWKLYYDSDPMAPDKIISKWGGFISDTLFNPLDYGITPRSIPVIEPLQLLLLETMRKTLVDGGYDERDFNRETACAVLGIGGGGSPLGVMYGIRSSLPIIDTAPSLPANSAATIHNAIKDMVPEWTEDSFPGFLMNVAVGRVANRFNLGGSNYAIDAACASSLAAVHSCIRELQLGTADVAFAMGADTVQTPYAFMAFSKTHALSAKGRCRPFDAEADGIVLSEGLGVVMLKRLDDARRDGDKIYGVIRGIGSSSDGRDKGLTAPNASGQLRALRRAYEQARIEPSTIGLVEAHGTGTVVGDRTEATSVATILDESGARRQSVAIGSVKSMIGHSKCAAGVAGLIKTAMALHTKTLPPTLVESPSPVVDFPNTGLYLNTESRPWVHGAAHPRRAGVSAFGFGGTNVHLVVEEYVDDFAGDEQPARTAWPVELFVWRGDSTSALKASLQRFQDWLSAGAKPNLAELGASLADAYEAADSSPFVASIVAKDREQLIAHLAIAIEKLESQSANSQSLQLSDPRGIYLSSIDVDAENKVALLFPGQGAQYPDMLSELLLAFPAARAAVDHAATKYDQQLDGRFAQLIYPPSAFSDDEREAHRKQLAETSVAQPALAATEWAALEVVRSLGIEPDCLGGHSFGEFVALAAAGAIDFGDLLTLAGARGQAMKAAAESGSTGGTMAAVAADMQAVADVLRAASLDEAITIANDNSPKQVVISGSGQDVMVASQKLVAAGYRVVPLDVSCAFHSPQVAGAATEFSKTLTAIDWKSPGKNVFSNTTATPHQSSTKSLLSVLGKHLASPVRFREQIEAMYESGARCFIEVGPGSALSGLVTQTLADRPHTAVSIDRRGRDSLTQLTHAVASLISAGVAIKPSGLFAPRNPRRINLRKLDPDEGQEKPPKTAWVVNGMRSRPIEAPEKHLLGQHRPGIVKPEKSKSLGSDAVAAQPDGRAVDSKTKRVNTSHSTAVPESPPSVSSTSAPNRSTTMQASTPTHRLTTQNPSAPETPTVCQDEATAVMIGYQQLMRQFLQTQRDVMLTYLQGEAPETAATDPINLPEIAMPAATSPVRSAYSQPVSRNGDNGHAAKPASRAVEPAAPAPSPTPVVSTPAPNAPESTQVSSATEPAVSGATSIASIDQAEEALLELVSDRTGYPVDMLDLEADLEGDLGIDSIKRVEILGNLAESLDLGDDDADLQDTLELEKLTTIRTLRGILDYLDEAIFSDDAKKKVKS